MMTNRFSDPLDHVRVAAPCTADWSRMTGSEQVRFCGQCNLNVYNLSGMTKREAEALVMRAEGRLCVRFYRRPDGTILTSNCPTGLRALKRRVSRTANAALSALLTFLAGLGLSSAWRTGEASLARETERPTMGTTTEMIPTPFVDLPDEQGVLAAPLPGVGPEPVLGTYDAPPEEFLVAGQMELSVDSVAEQFVRQRGSSGKRNR